MSKYLFGKETKVINKEGLTDSDYNGSNGEYYCKEISKEDYDELKEKGY